MQHKPPRLLASCSLIVFLSGLIWIFYQSAPSKTNINPQGFPSIGNLNSKIHLIVFEEPLCSHCQRFSSEVYPKLYENYIKTNKIRYTVVTLSFLPSSMPAALSWLCVYHQNSKAFFPYIEKAYESNANKNMKSLINLAHEMELNTVNMKKCVDKKIYLTEIEKNNALGRRLMEGSLSSPVLYINGEKIQELTYDNIEKVIESYEQPS